MAEFEWRQNVFHSYPARLIAQPFKWSSVGMILLNITIQGHQDKGIYNPRCVGVTLSYAWVARHTLLTNH